MSFLRAVGLGYDAPAPIAGRTVTLRAPELSDYEAWADLRARSRAFLEPWEPIWPPDDLTRSAFRRRVTRYRQDWRDDVGYAFLVHRNHDQALVGGLTLTQVRRGVAQTCSLGYWMGEPFARQGLMSAAVRTLAPHVFGPMGLRRIEAACVPENLASTRLLEGVGFQREGLARGYLCIAGTWRDHLLFALLKGDPVRPG